MTICHQCKRKWKEDSEQASAIHLYDRCIVCCVEAEKIEDFVWSIDKVLKKQKNNYRGKLV